jgi:HEAT repeat protein
MRKVMIERLPSAYVLVDASACTLLGPLPDNDRATQLAKDALRDPKPEVRVAAATALGKMRAASSVAQLKKALSDKEFSVVLDELRRGRTDFSCEDW